MNNLPAVKSRVYRNLVEHQAQLQAVLDSATLLFARAEAFRNNPSAKGRALLDRLGEELVLDLTATGAPEKQICKYLGIPAGSVSAWSTSCATRQKRLLGARNAQNEDKAFQVLKQAMELPEELSSSRARAERIKVGAAAKVLGVSESTSKQSNVTTGSGNVYHVNMFGGPKLKVPREIAGKVIEGSTGESDPHDE